jgi:1-acyl-sn-glycerol-3-phosphate acyltransferase
MSVTWSLKARRATRFIMQSAFKAGAFVYGIRIQTRGMLAAHRPLIIVSNHFSYLDLFVLGSAMPAAFTPKSEIRSWPVIGFMCKVSGCLFIDRRRTQTLENKTLLTDALAAGDIISLFPEGTTSDGTGLLPFKSSFFSLAEETGTPVQAISIVYTKLNHKPITSSELPIIGWYGDSFFFPHLMHYAKQRGLEVTLVFHPPINANAFTSRKALANHCRSMIEQGISDELKRV